MAKELTEYALLARRKYQRDQYRKRKAADALPPDRYTPEQRREYNRQYHEGKRGKEINVDFWNRKGDLFYHEK